MSPPVVRTASFPHRGSCLLALFPRQQVGGLHSPLPRRQWEAEKPEHRSSSLPHPRGLSWTEAGPPVVTAASPQAGLGHKLHVWILFLPPRPQDRALLFFVHSL
jgi:hypothetical protein